MRLFPRFSSNHPTNGGGSTSDSPTDDGLRHTLIGDHRRCDELWSQVEEAAKSQDAALVSRSFEAFDAAMRDHLGFEEEVVFPAFERATGMEGGPTMVMRGEHEQMNALLMRMGNAAVRGAHRELVDLGDTLVMLIGQHNEKEENILYPMAEEALASEWPNLRAERESLPAGGCSCGERKASTTA